MPAEPAVKRAMAFFDGQNLFHAAKDAFGYTFPNYDPVALTNLVCSRNNWQPVKVNFYTGIPNRTDNLFWNRYWESKLRTMSRQGVKVFSRPLRYRNKVLHMPDGQVYSFHVGEEKGIDVRLALDVISSVAQNLCDVALIFSQDQDLSELADEIRVLARQQKRWIKIACAYPTSPTCRNSRGINKTDWHPISRNDYDCCLDPRDHRPATQDSL